MPPVDTAEPCAGTGRPLPGTLEAAAGPDGRSVLDRLGALLPRVAEPVEDVGDGDGALEDVGARAAGGTR